MIGRLRCNITAKKSYTDSDFSREPEMAQYCGRSEGESGSSTLTFSCITHTVIDLGKADPPHKTLEERLVEFYGRPIEKIECIQRHKEDCGKDQGSEIVLQEGGGDSNG